MAFNFKSMGVLVSVACASSDVVFEDAADALSLLQLRSNMVVAAPGDKYCEGIVYPCQNAGRPTQDLDEAKRICDANEACMGIHLLRINDYWYQLGPKSDGAAYGKGTNWGGQNAQKSVLVKNCDDALVLPASNCASTEYVEGRVDNAQVGVMGARSQSEAEQRCSRDPTCLGIWYHRSNRVWHCYYPNLDGEGRRPYSYWAGWNGWQADVNTQFVKVKGCVTTTTTTTTTTTVAALPPVDEAAAVGDPHMTLSSGHKEDLCCENGKCEPCSAK